LIAVLDEGFGDLAGKAEGFVNDDGLGAAFDDDTVDFLPGEGVACLGSSGLGGEDVGAIDFIHELEPEGDGGRAGGVGGHDRYADRAQADQEDESEGKDEPQRKAFQTGGKDGKGELR